MPPSDAFSEQCSLVHSTISNLKQSDDAQVSKEILRHIETTRQTRQAQLDKQQETLQLLSRRLQATRSRVDASRAQREAKSHTEVMREMELERQSIEQVVQTQEAWRDKLVDRVKELEVELQRLSENVEEEVQVDAAVLKLRILRGLGVEPLVDENGKVDAARAWGEGKADVVKVADADGVGDADRVLAANLWALCL
ncbi:hypothetical protein GGI07_001835 [Coemansia sp. Benny D115]|nr:hypothetical protein GGI07_001835 [Coemansia sp. Benny D115]